MASISALITAQCFKSIWKACFNLSPIDYSLFSFPLSLLIFFICLSLLALSSLSLSLFISLAASFFYLCFCSHLKIPHASIHPPIQLFVNPSISLPSQLRINKTFQLKQPRANGPCMLPMKRCHDSSVTVISTRGCNRAEYYGRRKGGRALQQGAQQVFSDRVGRALRSEKRKLQQIN